MNEIAKRLQVVQQRIANAATAVGRSVAEIRLLAVSKTKPSSAVELAYQAGQRAFGENYAQEGALKIQQLQHLSDIEWHFIGPLQSNKTKLVAEHFDWIHSVDREKLIDRLAAQRPPQLAPLQVCLQINISEEPQKAGIKSTQMLPLAAKIAALPTLQLRGLMAIVEDSDDPAVLEQQFAAMQQLFQQLQKHHAEIDTLSMGMSDDMDSAIAHGSTLVRIGSAIFGARDYGKHNDNS